MTLCDCLKNAQVNVYGVEIPGNDGRCGMAAIGLEGGAGMCAIASLPLAFILLLTAGSFHPLLLLLSAVPPHAPQPKSISMLSPNTLSNTWYLSPRTL